MRPESRGACSGDSRTRRTAGALGARHDRRPRARLRGRLAVQRRGVGAGRARDERPEGDDLAEAFFHLARVEERNGARDEHDRFRAASSCLDPLDPPLERLRARLGVEPPRWGGARFAVALTHDVDVPWKWTRLGVKGAAARAKTDLTNGRVATRAARAARPRRPPPCTRCAAPIRTGASTGSSRTSGAPVRRRRSSCSPTTRTSSTEPRPRRTSGCGRGSSRRSRTGKAEVGLHGSYSAADDAQRIADEKERLERLSGPVQGQRYHYLRIDPHRNLGALEAAGFAYDSSLGFGDAVGFRAGIAHPFRPWDFERDAPHDLIEVPLAAMDVTLSAERYLNLSVEQAGKRLSALLDWAEQHGGGFAILWHSEQYDSALLPGWDVLYRRLLEEVRARGGGAFRPGPSRRRLARGCRDAADSDLPRGRGAARLVGALPRARARGTRSARARSRPARARARAHPAADRGLGVRADRPGCGLRARAGPSAHVRRRDRRVVRLEPGRARRRARAHVRLRRDDHDDALARRRLLGRVARPGADAGAGSLGVRASA